MPESYQRLERLVMCVRQEIPDLAVEAITVWSRRLETPSKPGALGDPCAADRISSVLKGEESLDHVFGGIEKLSGEQSESNQGGSGSGGVVGASRILEASRTRICSPESGSQVLVLKVTGSQVTAI